MPRQRWSKHDERQYKSILRRCKRNKKACKRVAAATVNKRRRSQGLGAVPPPIPAAAKRKCIAWRYDGNARRCAIYSNETGFRTAKPPELPKMRF